MRLLIVLVVVAVVVGCFCLTYELIQDLRLNRSLLLILGTNDLEENNIADERIMKLHVIMKTDEEQPSTFNNIHDKNKSCIPVFLMNIEPDKHNPCIMLSTLTN